MNKFENVKDTKNLKQYKNDKLSYAVLKNIVAFLNSSSGGSVVIGVKENKKSDKNQLIGIEKDLICLNADPDKLIYTIGQNIQSKISTSFADRIEITSFIFDDKKFIVINIVGRKKNSAKAYLNDGTEQRFYQRNNNITKELKGTKIDEYWKEA